MSPRDEQISAPVAAVDFYWRRGCGFCSALDRGLSRAGIPVNRKDIWADPEHAAFVRSVAGGNETVPTVVVGATALVNPRVGQVLEVVRTHAPHLVPDTDTDTGADDEPGSDGGTLERLAQRLFGN